MEIKLTEKQYEKLLKLTYLGMWIVEAHDQEKDNYFTEIEQIIFSKYSELENQKLIEYNEGTKKYLPAIHFDKEDIIVEYLDTYEENVFWDELIDRLTKRDMIKKYGIDAIQKMTREEVFERENEFISKYETEFQDSGIENLYIK